MKASIMALIGEIERNPLRGLIEPEEKREALEIIARIERAMLDKGIEGDRKWSARG